MRSNLQRVEWLFRRFLISELDAAMDGDSTHPGLAEQIVNLLKPEFAHMVDTISTQVAAAIASIQPNLASLAADQTAIAADVTTILGSMPVGSVVTQEQADALTAAAASLAAQVAAADAIKSTLDAAMPPAAPAA